MSRRGLLVAVLLVSAAASLRADAWARGKRAGYIYTGYAGTSSTEAFAPDGSRIPFPGRGAQQRRLSIYSELGISERVTIVAGFPYSELTARGFFTDFTTRDTGDLDFRVRATAGAGAGFVAIEAGAFIPLGYDTDAFPQLGSGEVEPVLNFAYGRGLPLLPSGFISTQLGYRWRPDRLANEIPYSVKAGLFPHPRIGTFFFVTGWESEGDFSNLDPSFALTSASSERLAVGGELYLHATRTIDLNVSWLRVARGRNTGTGDELGAGVAFRWSR